MNMTGRPEDCDPNNPRSFQDLRSQTGGVIRRDRGWSPQLRHSFRPKDLNGPEAVQATGVDVSVNVNRAVLLRVTEARKARASILGR